MISGPLIRKKLASDSLATARASRVLPVPAAVEQQPLGRLDAEPFEQFGIAQRQLDHLAQLVDRRRHAADIVIGDVGAALRRLLIFGAQLDLGILVDMDDALGARRDHREADLLQGISGGVHELLDARRHVADALMPRGRDDIALAERPTEEGPLERLRLDLQPQILLRRREDDARRGLRFDLAHLDEVTRADAGIGALQTVDAQHLDPPRPRYTAHRPRRRRLFADDLDHVAFADAERRHQLRGRCARPRPESSGRLFATWILRVGVSLSAMQLESSKRRRGWQIGARERTRYRRQKPKKGPARRPAHESF